jgi:acyl-CoA synthetase (AMP-forming)/AMP-acid ligase II
VAGEISNEPERVVTPLLSVDAAIARVIAGVEPLEAETVALADAAGRILAAPLAARRTQPPFAASAMDGYAVAAADLAAVPARLKVVGASGAGHGFAGTVGAGEAVRISTGAPVPSGADAILIQENAEARDDATVIAKETVAAGRHVRPAGQDFRAGAIMLEAGRRLGMREVALAAAIGKPDPVRTEIVKAFVVLKAGHAPSAALAADIQAFVRTHLSAHEYPREVAFIDAMPMTTTGKVIRRLLRAQA